MQGINKAILLLALSQLGACAVMSKQECLNADWRNVGYGVGLNGNINKSDAFNIRQRACEKHGASANWLQFQQGHADGVVQYCQLSNAVELGIKGASKAIDKQICREHDYPGFGEAFSVGYKLHVLRDRIYQSNSNITTLNNRLSRYRKDIHRINEALNAEDLDKSERKHLQRERRKIRSYVYDLDREIEHCRQRQYQQKSAESDYSDYVYQDYLLSLSDRFIDPRNKKREQAEKPNQSEFEDRVDEVLDGY